jgi:hypothetical protein
MDPDLGLGGFALITEDRTVTLPAGDSRLLFLGVADGIESPSAILTGLPAGVLEKNRDAQVLSPAALVAATLGRTVTLVRTNRKTGRTTRTPGKVRADQDGVLFESSEGIEALYCSGLPETFHFESTADLSPTPTLSVRALSDHPLTAKVTLSYLAHGFDWAANYTATLSADQRSLDIGAWVTLANANSVSFPDSHLAVVAGRLNRERPADEADDGQDDILAECWPRGSTSDIPGEPTPPPPPGKYAPSPLEEITVTGSRIKHESGLEAEQLGDLKLYRVPGTTSVNAQQMKQVRLLDRKQVPVNLLYIADLQADEETDTAARRALRTRNDRSHHLGLPLPSGRVDTFEAHGETPLLLEQAPLSDIAVGEELEIGAGEAADVQVRVLDEKTTINAGKATPLPRLPGVVHLRHAVRDDMRRIEITNARSRDILFEARLRLPYLMQLIEAEPAPVARNGRQVLTARVPAGGRVVMHYRTEHIE